MQIIVALISFGSTEQITVDLDTTTLRHRLNILSLHSQGEVRSTISSLNQRSIDIHGAERSRNLQQPTSRPMHEPTSSSCETQPGTSRLLSSVRLLTTPI